MEKTKFSLGSLVLLFAIVIGNSPALALPTVSLQPSNTSPPVGSFFSVLVNIAAVTDLYSYQFDVHYNPAILSATSVTEGLFLPSGGTTSFIPGTIDNIGGTISFTAGTLIGSVPGVTGSGNLATLNFSAIAKGTSPLALANVVLLDSNLGDIEFVTSGATVSPVSGGTKIPEANSGLLIGVGLLGMVILRNLRECL